MAHNEFEKRLEAYREGWLSPEEMAAIEAEIERAKAIQDYLAEDAKRFEEKTEIAVLDAEIPLSVKAETVSGRGLKQSLLICCLIAISGVSLLLLWHFTVVPLVNGYYYNPQAGQKKDRPSDYDVYQRVKSNVYVSEDFYLDQSIRQTGIGTYDIIARYIDPFKLEISQRQLLIKRNELVYERTFGTTSLTVNSLYVADGKRLLAEAPDSVSHLPDSTWLKVAIGFEKPLSMSEVAVFEKEKRIFPLHTQIKIGENLQDSTESGFGFRIGFGKSRFRQEVFSLEERELINQDYPNLFPVEMDFEVEEHVVSSLSYLVDHQEGVPTDESESESIVKKLQKTKQALTYVVENGVKITGLTLVATKEDFFELLKDKQVYRLEVLDANVYAPYLDFEYFQYYK